MFVKPLVELLGTFFFLTIILTQGQAIPIAVGLLAAIYMGGHVSGGHFNPAVTFMKFMSGEMAAMDTTMYVVGQLLGAMLALFVAKQLLMRA